MSAPLPQRSKRIALAYLLVVLAVAVLGVNAITVAARVARIPPPLDDNLAVSERLQFVKNYRTSEPVVLALGSSLAMFNLDTARLSAIEGRPFVNLGAAGATPADLPLLYSYYEQVVPIDEVILLTNYFELRRSAPDLTSPKSVVLRYLQGKMSFPEEASYRDWKSLTSYVRDWKELRDRTSLNSVAFDRTGAVPVQAVAREYDPDNWAATQVTTEAGCNDCMATVESLCRTIRAQKKRFTVVLTPVMAGALKDAPQLQAMKVDRRARIQAIVTQCGGELVDLGDAPFSATCFVDLEHLNARGMSKLADIVAQRRTGNLAGRAGTETTCT